MRCTILPAGATHFPLFGEISALEAELAAHGHTIAWRTFFLIPRR